jgi:transcription initiation factor TFIIH subunit 1
MNEKEFWTLYFSSKHYHRNRSQKGPDIFEQYLQYDDHAVDAKIMYDAKNKLLDLTRTDQDSSAGGNAPDFSMKPGKVRESVPLIRKFNRHSENIIKNIMYKTLIQLNKAPKYLAIIRARNKI